MFRHLYPYKARISWNQKGMLVQRKIQHKYMTNPFEYACLLFMNIPLYLQSFPNR